MGNAALKNVGYTAIGPAQADDNPGAEVSAYNFVANHPPVSIFQ